MVMAPPPVLYGHTVVKVYPHDANAYTQGLLWHDGHLYESTGLEGQSSLRKVDLQRGTSIQKIDLDEHFFERGARPVERKALPAYVAKQQGLRV